MEIIEWCDEFRSSKRGGTRKSRSIRPWFVFQWIGCLDCITPYDPRCIDCHWLLTFFLDNQSILLLLLIAARCDGGRWADCRGNDSRHTAESDCDKERDWWQKSAWLSHVLLGQSHQTIVGRTFYVLYANALLHFNVVDLFVASKKNWGQNGRWRCLVV